jgi:DNA invertase Pin-like site-specific DNA recombinase
VKVVIHNRSAASQQAADTENVRHMVCTMLAYTRKSMLKADADVAGASTKAQGTRIKALAQQYGASIPEDGWHTDDGISAAYDQLHEDQPKHRPGFKALLEAIAQQRPAYVGCTFGDRLTRNQEEWVALLKVCARAGTKIVSEARVIDPRNHGDRMVGTFETFMAEQYVETIRVKVRSALADRRANGVPAFGGRRPYGLHVDKVTPYEPEAAVVRWLAASAIAGDSLRTMADALNRDGTLTPADARRADRGLKPNGHKWVAMTVKQVLRRAGNCGWIEHGGALIRPYAVVESGEVTPIMDRETFDRVLAVLDGRGTTQSLRGTHGRTSANGHFLTGLLRCGAPECNGPLHGGTKPGPTANPQDRVRTYKCQRHLSVDAEPVEEAVRALVLELRASPEHMHSVAEAAEGRTREWRALHERYMELGSRLDALADNLELTERVLARRTAALEAERAKLKAAMDKLDPTDPGAQASLHAKAAKRVAAEWDEAARLGNWPVLRGYVMDVVAGLRVMPTRRGKRTPVLDRLEVISLA